MFDPEIKEPDVHNVFGIFGLQDMEINTNGNDHCIKGWEVDFFPYHRRKFALMAVEIHVFK